MFVRDTNGDRLINSDFNNHLISQLSCAQFALVDKFNNAKRQVKKELYLGLIVYKNLIDMNYVYTSGGSYHQIFPIQLYTTRDKDALEIVLEDFKTWKTNRVSTLFKDPSKDVYFLGISKDYVKNLLDDLKACGFEGQKIEGLVENIVPFQDYLYIYDVFNTYNKDFWKKWREENKTVEKNLERYEVVPFSI